eukprot:m.101112 g.101112  ORF g.101112 m.101112 type:complete len:140 (+) comp16793_c0_seq2:298-717(+)
MGDHVRYHAPSSDSEPFPFPQMSQADMAKHPLTLGMTSMINSSDVERIAEIQASMLQRFEKTNAKLESFNDISAIKLDTAMKAFGHHTTLLLEAKKDLHSVFRRIRILKEKLSAQYPNGFTGAGQAVVTRDGEKIATDE